MSSPHRPPVRIMSRHRFAARTGFTLVELSVALAVTLILILIAGRMVSDSINTATAGSGLGEIIQHTQAIENNLRRDLRNISRDGYLVIRMANVNANLGEGTANEARAADQIFFLANSNYSSVNPTTVSPTSSAAIARIWYGHLSNAQFTASPADARTWSLGRQDLLLNPMQASAASVRAADLWDSTAWDGDRDIVNASLDSIRRTALSGTWRTSLLNASQRLQGERWAPLGQFMDIHALIANRCSSFRVEFAGDYNSDGNLDTAAGGNVVWYGLGRAANDGRPANSSVATGNGTVDTGRLADRWDAVFGWDKTATPWPWLIRVTYTLHDFKDKLEGIEVELILDVSDGRP